MTISISTVPRQDGPATRTGRQASKGQDALLPQVPRGDSLGEQAGDQERNELEPVLSTEELRP